ncbi:MULTISPECIES: metallophosphoesterase [unclassified Luteimonas]
MRVLLSALLLVPASAGLAEAPAREVEANTLVPAGVVRYAPSVFPDRIIAVPAQDASTGFAVSWRTGVGVEAPLLEITTAKDSPDQWDGDMPPRRLRAQTRTLDAGNGPAHHHRVAVDGLQAGTLYAWRVQGEGTWSPWRQLRTAAPAGTPLEFLYFGDTQNRNASLVTRVMHEALRHAPRADLALFAGDLVSEAVDDDEWGEWFDATLPQSATMLLAPAPGNHEFFEEFEDTPRERRVLGDPWQLHFALPGNGAAGVQATTYWFDYQGIRFAVLDGTSTLDLDAGPAQAAWLDTVLAANPHRWSIVLVHQPFHSPRAGRDNRALRRHLQPVVERHRVDLVLQGHDHTYGRRGGGSAKAATPQYVVSVAGPKQYRVSEQARATMSPVAEDTQLFQVLRLQDGRLSYEARTVTGRLYDAFTLVDQGAAGKRIEEQVEGRIDERRCLRAQTLRGRADRCWE